MSARLQPGERRRHRRHDPPDGVDHRSDRGRDRLRRHDRQCERQRQRRASPASSSGSTASTSAPRTRRRPYAVAWDTRGALNGAHTLTAVARDTSGNTQDVDSPSRSPSRTRASPRPASAPRTRSTRPRGRSAADCVRQRPQRHDRRHDVDDRAIRQRRLVRRRQRPHRPARARHLLQDRLHLRGVGAQADGQEGRRRARLAGTQEGGPMIWVDHVAGRYYLTLGGQHRRPTSTPAEHRPSASGSTSRRRTTAPPPASTSAASRWRARRSPAASATRTPGGWAPTSARPTGFFDGQIDNVRIYDRALSAARGPDRHGFRDPARDDPADRDRDDAGGRLERSQRRHHARRPPSTSR